MKHRAIIMLLAVSLFLPGCGSNNAGNVSGNWTATLTNPDGTPALSLTTTLSQSNGTTITGSNIVFTTATPCFQSVASETGGFTLTGNTNGVTTGNFELTIQSATPSGNVLTLQGTVSGNTITGTWTLTGVTTGCTGNGNFTMTKV